jgi:PadR family transcriptional regulator PadR
MTTSDSMVRNFFLGFIKVHILHHAAEGPLYGLAVMEELRRHGYVLGPGTVYPVLHGLTQAGYLVRQDRVVAGKVRKYYSITKAGRLALGQSRRLILELVREVVQQRPPPTSRRPKPARRETQAKPVQAGKRARS